MAALRKRLARDGLDDADQAARVKESFVTIGTPLPPLWAKRDPNEGKPEWEQEVRDEQGRRRFHGAFTGGWSAGYYNTVGSKEGWTPQTFLSTRKAKVGSSKGTPSGTSAQQQRPEDFMDEEDLAELEATRQLSNKTGYEAGVSSSDADRHAKGDVLGDLLGLGDQRAQLDRMQADTSGLVAPPTSLGHRILTRMGWKPGTGLGPKVTPKRRSWLSRKLGIPESTTPAPQLASTALVLPPDTPMPLADAGPLKQDTHGIGYVSANGRNARPNQFAKSVENQGGFGRSVLEDADEDDLDDIYTSNSTTENPLSSSRRSGAHGSKSQRQKTADIGLASNHKWRDGRNAPLGFIIIQKHGVDEHKGPGCTDWWPPPEVPEGWQPDPFRVLNQPKPQPLQSVAGVQPNATHRAQLLGEARMPGPPPSLSNYLPKAEPKTVTAPSIPAATAQAALRGFLPFSDDDAKQQRYRDYLSLNCDRAADMEVSVPLGKTAADVKAELDEFARSASIFRPLGGAMASRFASAQTVEGSGDTHAPTPGLYQPAPRSRAEIEEEARRKQEEDERRIEQEKEEKMTDKQKAARAGLFGPATTREVKQWYPPRLLCKRFGVPDPHPESSASRESVGDTVADGRAGPADDASTGFYDDGRADKYERSAARREIARGEARWQQSRRELMGMVGERRWEDTGGQPIKEKQRDNEASEAAGQDVNVGSTSQPRSLEQVGLGECDEAQLKEIETFVKPARSLFKSVFANDEDDEELAMSIADPKKATRDGTAPPAQTDATPPLAFDPADPHRPLFVPRPKRGTVTDRDADAGPGGVSSDGQQRKKAKKSKKAQAGVGGSLTFQFEGEDEEEVERSKSAAIKQDRDKSATRAPARKGQTTRVRASDLF